MVHPANVARITNFIETLEHPSDSTPWRDLSGQRGNVPASVLRGARGKEEITQTALSELTGIHSGIFLRWNVVRGLLVSASTCLSTAQSASMES